MLWKLFTLALILGFAAWRLRHWWRLLRLQRSGEAPEPAPRRMRPISWLAGLLLLIYGGYLAIVLARQALGTFGS